jgi:hypothetical protein
MTDSRTPEAIEADIAVQRQELAHTIDQLGAKFDVKSRARAKAADLQDRATTDDGKPRPELIGAAVALVALVAGVVWWRRR